MEIYYIDESGRLTGSASDGLELTTVQEIDGEIYLATDWIY